MGIDCRIPAPIGDLRDVVVGIVSVRDAIPLGIPILHNAKIIVVDVRGLVSLVVSNLNVALVQVGERGDATAGIPLCRDTASVVLGIGHKGVAVGIGDGFQPMLVVVGVL